MRKEQVKAMLEEHKRRKTIINFIVVLCVFVIISLVFLFLYFYKSRSYYVTYKEKSDLDYKVYLKKNDFFETEYLEKNNQYIASIIDHINADFLYNLKIDDLDVDFQYKYKIEANVSVIDDETKNTIFTKTLDLVPEETYTSHKKSYVNIHENLDIDYNYYNNLIKKFIKVYDLNKTVSTLNINMYVSVQGNCESIENSETNKVITLSIPLTTKTVAIDMNYDVLNDGIERVMICNDEEDGYIYLIVGLISSILSLIIFYRLIKYTVSSRTAEGIYHRELRRILNNYRSYIQKVNNQLDLRGYKVLVIDTFTDMLEIRDTIQEPILMIENKNKSGVFFVIPSKTKILYTYSIKVNDIIKKIDNEEF